MAKKWSPMIKTVKMTDATGSTEARRLPLQRQPLSSLKENGVGKDCPDEDQPKSAKRLPPVKGNSYFQAWIAIGKSDHRVTFLDR